VAELLRGAPVASAITEGLVPRVEALTARGVTPTLAIVRVGERDDDLSYERGAKKRCAKVGIDVRGFVLASDCSQRELMDVIARVNGDPSIHGCLMFRPLPRTLDQDAACAALDPAKDVDCITAGSLYGVFANQPTGFPPCTAEAVVALLDHYGYELSGARVTVVGRSLVIGKPVSMMLQARNATVTMCHTRTSDLAAECSRAQILVAAAGHAGTVGADCATPGQVVVDVGINWDESAGRLVGDVDFEAVEPIVRAITPVPGGVGSVTTAILARHVVEAAERTVQQP
jgi:methylenetetrahydrofolate dehydrogenase (NADP+)/methenyltetrahydrofolate cyclohydrolase